MNEDYQPRSHPTSRPPRSARCVAIELVALRLPKLAEREAERHGSTSGAVLEAQRAASNVTDRLVAALDRFRCPA